MFNLAGLPPFQPPFAPLPSDDAPPPKWVVDAIRDAHGLLTADLDPSPTARDRAIRILEQALRDAAAC